MGFDCGGLNFGRVTLELVQSAMEVVYYFSRGFYWMIDLLFQFKKKVILLYLKLRKTLS